MIRTRNYADNVTIKVDPATGAEYVDFSAGSVAIGETVAGGVAPAVLFIGAGNTLDQAPTLFGYDKVTGLLTRNLPGASDGSALESTQPTEAATPGWFRRLTGSVNADASFNPVMGRGWNLGSGGLPIDPAFGTVGDSVEGNFEGTGTFGGEYHIVFGRADGLEQVRAWSAFMKWATGHTEVQLTTDQFRIADAENPGGLSLLSMQGNETGVDQAATSLLTALGIGKHAADNDSFYLIFKGSPGKQHVMQINDVLGGLMSHITNGTPDWYYSDTGGAASQLFRTGVTMGRDGDKAAGVANLTLPPVTGQTAPLLDMSGAGAVPMLKMAKTAIVPVGALVQFKVQDETGGVFYITGQAA